MGPTAAYIGCGKARRHDDITRILNEKLTGVPPRAAISGALTNLGSCVQNLWPIRTPGIGIIEAPPRLFVAGKNYVQTIWKEEIKLGKLCTGAGSVGGLWKYLQNLFTGQWGFLRSPYLYHPGVGSSRKGTTCRWWHLLLSYHRLSFYYFVWVVSRISLVAGSRWQWFGFATGINVSSLLERLYYLVQEILVLSVLPTRNPQCGPYPLARLSFPLSTHLAGYRIDMTYAKRWQNLCKTCCPSFCKYVYNFSLP